MCDVCMHPLPTAPCMYARTSDHPNRQISLRGVQKLFYFLLSIKNDGPTGQPKFDQTRPSPKWPQPTCPKIDEKVSVSEFRFLETEIISVLKPKFWGPRKPENGNRNRKTETETETQFRFPNFGFGFRNRNRNETLVFSKIIYTLFIWILVWIALYFPLKNNSQNCIENENAT